MKLLIPELWVEQYPFYKDRFDIKWPTKVDMQLIKGIRLNQKNFGLHSIKSLRISCQSLIEFFVIIWSSFDSDTSTHQKIITLKKLEL